MLFVTLSVPFYLLMLSCCVCCFVLVSFSSFSLVDFGELLWCQYSSLYQKSNIKPMHLLIIYDDVDGLVSNNSKIIVLFVSVSVPFFLSNFLQLPFILKQNIIWLSSIISFTFSKTNRKHFCYWCCC